MAAPFLTLIVLTKQKMLQCDQGLQHILWPFWPSSGQKRSFEGHSQKKVNNDWNVATERILHQFIAWGKQKHTWKYSQSEWSYISKKCILIKKLNTQMFVNNSKFRW